MTSLHDLIRRFEGLRLKAYFCPAGVLTCGYGTTGPDIKADTVWTKEQAEQRMQQDAAKFVSGTRALCPGLEGDRLAAIADFAYNLGLTRLKGSTLRKRIKSGDWDGACVELRKWVRGGGRVLPGLVLRREAEIALIRAEAVSADQSSQKSDRGDGTRTKDLRIASIATDHPQHFHSNPPASTR